MSSCFVETLRKVILNFSQQIHLKFVHSVTSQILYCIDKTLLIYEPVHEKTSNLGSDQVQHKPGCTVTEDG